MGDNLTKYIRLNPLEILTYASVGILIGFKFWKFFDDGLNKMDYIQLGLGGLAGLLSVVSCGIKRASYERIGQIIRESGISQDLLRNREAKRMARIYCLENGLEREFMEKILEDRIYK